MIYRLLNDADLQGLMVLWNHYALLENHQYKKMNLEEIKSHFYESQETYQLITFVGIENDRLVGFSSGVYENHQNKAFLTYILVDIEYRRKHIASDLLKLLEANFKQYNQLENIDINFFNPIKLKWTIPNKTLCEHPNAPGVDMKNVGYAFMQSLGYIAYAYQNAYYRDLANFIYRDDIKILMKEINEKGIHISIFNSGKHFGFDELFDDLKSNAWRKEISNNLKKINGGDPIIIVEENGKICGFTGPLSVEKSKRGYFAGIGISSHYRGLGLGKILFANLCTELKQIGAEYMTLFTGENNPARKIYESEGFVIVRSWANMRKLIKRSD